MPVTQRTIFNTIVNEAGQPLAGVPVKAYLVTHQFVKGQSVEVIQVSVSAVSNAEGYWELSLVPNDTMEDPNSFYIIEEGMPTDKYYHRHYVRIPSGTGALPLEQARISPPFALPSIPPEGLVSGIMVAGQQPLKGQVTFEAGEGIALTQDNTTKTITIAQVARAVWQKIAVLSNGTLYGVRSKINFITGSNVSISVTDDAANDAVNVTISALGGGGGGGGAHSLLSDTHTDTQPAAVQRGMLIVGQLIGTVVKWAGLALGAAGKFLKSTGTDVVWGDVDWTEVQNKPATFPPSAHTHVKADITDFAHTHPPSQISPQGSGSGLDADTVDGQHASAFAPANHTHTKSQITDLEPITTTPTANAVPKADATGKISVGWIPQGSGSNLDADKLDGLDSTAFERVSNKGVANGYAPLDADAKLPTTHLPSHSHQSSEVDMPVTERTASYTLQLTDKNSFIKMNSTTAVTVTIPTNASVAFPLGTKIVIMKYGTGDVTIQGATGVALRDPNNQATITTQYDVRVIVKIGTNEWVVV